MSKNRKCWEIILLLILFLIAICVLSQYVFGGYYFFSKGYLSDLLRINIPTYYYIYDALSEGGFFWSWEMGIGTSMFAHADAFFDPFTYILFIFGRDHIPAMMIWLYIAKIVAEGFAFYFYIRFFKVNHFASILGAVAYAFSGYSMIMGSNLALGTILVYLPIVLLGLEYYINEDRFLLLLFSVFLTAIYSLYFCFQLLVFIVLYHAVRLMMKQAFHPIKCFKMWLILIVAIVLSSFSIIPSIQLMMNSPRTSNAKDYVWNMSLLVPDIRVLLTAMGRAINNNAFGDGVVSPYQGVTYQNRVDIFQISCYSSVCLYICYLHILKMKKWRRTIIYISVIVIAAISIPFFSLFLNAFSTITGRWMFVLSILFSIIISLGFEYIINYGIDISLVMTGSLIGILILFAGNILVLRTPFNMDSIISILLQRKDCILLSIFCLILFIYIGIIYINRNAFLNRIFPGVMLTLVFVDICLNYHSWYNTNQAVSDYSQEAKTSFDDDANRLICRINNSDNSFFRIDRSFDSVYNNAGIPSENDAMVQHYHGIKSYVSINNPNYIEFLQSSGIYLGHPNEVSYNISHGQSPYDIKGQSLNYIDGVRDRYDLLSYLGVKYYLTNDQSVLPDNFVLIDEMNEIRVYLNTDYYPLAFVNQDLVYQNEFLKMNNVEKDMYLLTHTIIDGETHDEVMINPEGDATVIEKQNAFHLDSFQSDHIIFSIDTPENEEECYYLSTTIPYDKDWNIYIDGNKVESKKINISMLGCLISGGGVKHVELRYTPKAYYLGVLLSLVSAAGVCCLYCYRFFNLRNESKQN